MADRNGAQYYALQERSYLYQEHNYFAYEMKVPSFPASVEVNVKIDKILSIFTLTRSCQSL